MLQVPHRRSSCSCRSTPLIMMGLLLCSSWRCLMSSCLKPTCGDNQHCFKSGWLPGRLESASGQHAVVVSRLASVLPALL